jgi:hypothetical protein
MSINTNYAGQFYYGEYPLSFAAILKQEECVRLLLAYGADINIQGINSSILNQTNAVYTIYKS